MNFRPRSNTRHLWDTWFYDHNGVFYLYYLSNPVGDDGSWKPWDAYSLAVSTDLIHWEERGEVFKKSDNPSDWDSQIITTGDIIKFKNRFYMSYRATTNRIERNNIIVSDDLLDWRRISNEPVLHTSHPYEGDPSQTINNYVEMRDVTMTELPDGSVEGVFTARINSGPHTGRGVLGRAYTQDMKEWRLGEPLFSPGIFNVIEVPSRYTKDGRYYLLFCVNSHLESEIGSETYPRMQFCTGYAVSDQFDTGFRYNPDQVLGIGDAYVGRIVDAGSETLFLHHLVSERPAFCFPKTVVFNDDGTIHLGYWSGIDALASGETVSGFGGIHPGVSNGLPVCTCVMNGEYCTLENSTGFGEAYLSDRYADYVLDITIDAVNCRSVGLLLNCSEDEKSGVMLTVNRENGSITIGRSKKTYGHIAPHDVRHEYRGHEAAAEVIDVKVVSRSEGFDWYVGGKHILTTVDETHRSGQIGAFVRGGSARFSKLAILPLRPEIVE